MSGTVFPRVFWKYLLGKFLSDPCIVSHAKATTAGLHLKE